MLNITLNMSTITTVTNDAGTRAIIHRHPEADGYLVTFYLGAIAGLTGERHIVPAYQNSYGEALRYAVEALARKEGW